MAIMFEGFSIREYAAKMRSVDVGKCWPFGEIDKEDIGPLLPPITVTKFRWWSDELELLKSMESSGVEENPRGHQAIISRNFDGDFVADDEGPEEVEKLVEETEKFDMACPVCPVFTAATANALNAHVDSLSPASREERRQMRLAMKGKSRAPKKRSIVEIFAVSQQIERVVGENLDEETGQEELNVKIRSKRKKKMKKVKVVDKLIKKRRKKKKKKKKKKTLKTGLIGKNKLQENTNKLKLQTSVKVTGELNDSLCNKGFTKDILDSVTIHRKKQHLKCSSSQKKHKVVQASKLMTKHQEPVLPVRGILKKYKKDVPRQNATICRLQDANQVDPCGIQNLDRHVRFCGENDILGPRKRTASSSEKSNCNLYLDAFASSSGRDRSMGSEKGFAAINGMDGDAVSINTENGSGVQSMNEKDLFPDGHDHVDIPNFLRPHVTQEKLNHLSEKSISLSQVLLHGDDLHMFDQRSQITCHKPPYAAIPKLLSVINEIRNPRINSQFHGTISRASDSSAKLTNYFEKYSHGVDEMNSMENMRGFRQPSSSGFTLNGISNVRLPSAAENMTVRALQPSSHLSAMESRGSLCPFPEWNQRPVSFRHEEFLGLPLNSQGELIQASSNGKTSCLPVDNFDLQRSLGCSSWMNERHFVERTIAKDQLNLFSGENYVKENPNMHLPARLGVAELPISVKEDIHWLNSGSGSNHSRCLLDSDQNLTNAFNGIRQYDQLQKKDRNKVVHPKENSDLMSINTTQLTMRLMGKDVAISRSSTEMQGFPDGKVWTDKEIIAEHHTSSTAGDYLSVKRQEVCPLNPASGKSNQSIGIQNNEAPQSDTLMNAPDSGLFYPFVNWKSNSAVFQNGIFPSNRNHGAQRHHIAFSPNFPAMFDRETEFQEPLTPRPESLGVSSRRPSVSTTHFNQQINWRPAELKYKQSFSQATKSNFSFPFLQPDCSEPLQQSSSQSSSKSPLPWLLQTTQAAKTPMAPCQPFADMDQRYYPYTTEMNLHPTLSVHQPPVAYPFNPPTFQPDMQSSLGPVSRAHSSLAPALSGTRPTSSINPNFGNRNKVIDRMQSKSLEFKGFRYCQKTKKRSASKEEYSTMHTKKPNIGIQEDLGTVTELTREDYRRSIQGNAGAYELNSSRDQASCSGCGLSERPEDVSALAVLARKHLSQDIQNHDKQLVLDPNSIEASGIGRVLNENQSTGVRTSAYVDPCKADAMARSGPVKLSAGAKHIFKPSQNMDQDTSKLVHSTIPFVAVPDTNILLESQKKSSKIYRF